MKNSNKFKDIQAKLKYQKSLIYFDIETKPIKFWGWSTGQQYVTHEQIYEDSKVILIQWMFEGDKKVSYLHWDYNHDDYKLLYQFQKIIENVKVGIGQNGKYFDYKVLNWRLNLHKLPPLRDIQILDTLMLSRGAFRASSHRLDYKSKTYGSGGKIPMRLQDWIDVVEDKPGALKKMIKYGCKDVTDLRDIFWRELPYYHNLPVSLSQLVYPKTKEARECCPKCAANHQRKFDVYPTKVFTKWMMKCNNCGNIWKETRQLKKLDFEEKQ
jgi:uncharacterized protein YprB with RNaseH-like and TPR domain